MHPTQLEPIVVDIFREVLRNATLTAEDDFFGSGGDSLTAVDAIHRISAAVDEEIDPMIIFMYPTAVSFTEAISDVVRSGA
jgi:acyl carrier protein